MEGDIQRKNMSRMLEDDQDEGWVKIQEEDII